MLSGIRPRCRGTVLTDVIMTLGKVRTTAGSRSASSRSTWSHGRSTSLRGATETFSSANRRSKQDILWRRFLYTQQHPRQLTHRGRNFSTKRQGNNERVLTNTWTKEKEAALRADFRRWAARETKILLFMLVGGTLAVYFWKHRSGAPPLQVQQLFVEAKEALSQNDLRGAAKLLGQARAVLQLDNEDDPMVVEIAYKIGELYERNKDHQSARRYYLQALHSFEAYEKKTFESRVAKEGAHNGVSTTEERTENDLKRVQTRGLFSLSAPTRIKDLSSLYLVILDRLAQIAHFRGDRVTAREYYVRAGMSIEQYVEAMKALAQRRSTEAKSHSDKKKTQQWQRASDLPELTGEAFASEACGIFYNFAVFEIEAERWREAEALLTRAQEFAQSKKTKSPDQREKDGMIAELLADVRQQMEDHSARERSGVTGRGCENTMVKRRTRAKISQVS